MIGKLVILRIDLGCNREFLYLRLGALHGQLQSLLHLFAYHVLSKGRNEMLDPPGHNHAVWL